MGRDVDVIKTIEFKTKRKEKNVGTKKQNSPLCEVAIRLSGLAIFFVVFIYHFFLSIFLTCSFARTLSLVVVIQYLCCEEKKQNEKCENNLI